MYTPPFTRRSKPYIPPNGDNNALGQMPDGLRLAAVIKGVKTHQESACIPPRSKPYIPPNGDTNALGQMQDGVRLAAVIKGVKTHQASACIPPRSKPYIPPNGDTNALGQMQDGVRLQPPSPPHGPSFFYHRQLAVPMLFIHSVSRKDTPQNNPGNKGTHEPWV